MKNIAFDIPSQELNQALSNASSEPKRQVSELVDNELLSDEELAAINGGTGGGTDWNFLDDTINAVGDFFARIYNSGEGMGDSISDYQNRNGSCQ